ncbi:MAG: hypothetical protein U0527_02455 [Candidatus Eisenbacteria bacterium]
MTKQCVRSRGVVARFGVIGGAGAVALFALCTTRAEAVEPTARVSLTGGLGAVAVAAKDLNDEIDRGNRFAARQDWISLDNLNHAFNFNWDLRSALAGPFTLGVGGGVTSMRSRVDFDQVIEVHARGNLYHLHLEYLLPWSPRPSSVRLFGVGGPLLLSNAKVDVTHQARTADGGVLRQDDMTISGSSVGAEVMLAAEMIFSERVTFVADFGYRYAKANGDKFTWHASRVADPLLDRDGDGTRDGEELGAESYLLESFLTGDRWAPRQNKDIDLDFSGPQANVGLRFYLF